MNFRKLPLQDDSKTDETYSNFESLNRMWTFET